MGGVAMVQAGKFNRRITLQAPATGQDAAGQPLNGWVDVAQLWADIRTTGGLEAIKAGAATSVVQRSVRLRWRTGLNAGMRVLHGAAVYNVLAVLPDEATRQFVDLVCQEVA